MIFKKKSLKILFVATEAAPFARVGGMGSVMHDLPVALANLGNDVRLFIPKYLGVGKGMKLTEEIKGLEVPTENKEKEKFFNCDIWKWQTEGKKEDSVTTYFLDNQEYFGSRANIYGYADDPLRWALLSRGALEFLKSSEWMPDIIVSNDWHTGFLPNYLKSYYADLPKFKDVSSIFCIHNLHFQGNFRHKYAEEKDLDEGLSLIPAFEDPKLLQINGMKRGIIYSDAINTVSPTYAKEILTPELGEGLDNLLNERKEDLFGIINGIDYRVWGINADKLLASNFSANDLEKRIKNRKKLVEDLNLEITDETFIIGILSRMSAQKGFDLLNPVLKSLLRELDIALVIVGEGDPRYMEFFNELSEKFPKRVSVNFRFDPYLPHLVFAGVDSVLIPSKFEPSGLTQMEAMHYGAVPIVRKTGGLADTVVDYRQEDKESNGFVFCKFDSFSMLISVMRAYENFRNKSVWTRLQKAGMKRDFSWNRSAKEYMVLFNKVKSLPKSNILTPKGDNAPIN
ncbi:MAG: glycogen/starch synthase [Candidatus Paceibacterota bacterium]